jgi:hypothetical protein
MGFASGAIILRHGRALEGFTFCRCAFSLLGGLSIPGGEYYKCLRNVLLSVIGLVRVSCG